MGAKITREIVLQTMSDSGRLMQLPREGNMGGDVKKRGCLPSGKTLRCRVAD